jgi:hypothetical protein
MRVCVALSVPFKTAWKVAETFGFILLNIALTTVLLGYLSMQHSPGILFALKEAP